MNPKLYLQTRNLKAFARWLHKFCYETFKNKKDITLMDHLPKLRKEIKYNWQSNKMWTKGISW